MEQRETHQLIQEFGLLRGTMEEGFKGTHRRQDIANGRMAKLEDRVDAIEKDDIRVAGFITENTESRKRSQSVRDVWIDRLLLFVLFLAGQLSLVVLLKTNIINL